jgi:hypothetical protein
VAEGPELGVKVEDRWLPGPVEGDGVGLSMRAVGLAMARWLRELAGGQTVQGA